MPEDDEEEWRFSVEDVGDSPPAESAGADAGADGDQAATGEDAEDDDANVAGEFAPKVPVEPQELGGENALFVTLGAVLSVLALVAVVRGPAFGLVDVLVVTLVVGAIGGGIYAVLVRLTPEMPDAAEDTSDSPDTPDT